MKIVHVIFCLFLFISCASSKEISFTASTPAGTLARSFLGIPLEDSVDFIRWKLILDDDKYNLQCNYGIGKPNSNGFINNGKSIAMNGTFKKEQNMLMLRHDDRVLSIIEFNSNLLHLLDENNKLLSGNGGWSYTLNNTDPVLTSDINTNPPQHLLKDSIIFDGRTPCNVPGILPAGMQCYKLKWRFIFYADKENKEQGHYKIKGTAWRNMESKMGSWKINKGKNNQLTYQLYDEKGNALIYLLKADENILLFTDAAGNLLVGNEDFSYTLNRKI